MAHARHATTRSSRYALGSADVSSARGVALLVLAVPLVAGALVLVSLSRSAASDAATARQLASLNPRSLFSDDTQHFLPAPVAVIPPDAGAGPPVPASGEPANQPAAASLVKVANTGGVGAVLRADPPRGRQVAALRDGQVLEVLDGQQVGGAEWLHVRTQNGVEGWIFGRLVGPAG